MNHRNRLTDYGPHGLRHECRATILRGPIPSEPYCLADVTNSAGDFLPRMPMICPELPVGTHGTARYISRPGRGGWFFEADPAPIEADADDQRDPGPDYQPDEDDEGLSPEAMTRALLSEAEDAAVASDTYGGAQPVARTPVLVFFASDDILLKAARSFPDYANFPGGEGDYRLAALLSLPTDSVPRLLSRTFAICQNVETRWIDSSDVLRGYPTPPYHSLRSMSVGDVVCIDGQFWECQQVGWTQVDFSSPQLKPEPEPRPARQPSPDGTFSVGDRVTLRPEAFEPYRVHGEIIEPTFPQKQRGVVYLVEGTRELAGMLRQQLRLNGLDGFYHYSHFMLAQEE